MACKRPSKPPWRNEPLLESATSCAIYSEINATAKSSDRKAGSRRIAHRLLAMPPDLAAANLKPSLWGGSAGLLLSHGSPRQIRRRTATSQTLAPGEALRRRPPGLAAPTAPWVPAAGKLIARALDQPPAEGPVRGGCGAGPGEMDQLVRHSAITCAGSNLRASFISLECIRSAELASLGYSKGRYWLPSHRSSSHEAALSFNHYTPASAADVGSLHLDWNGCFAGARNSSCRTGRSDHYGPCRRCCCGTSAAEHESACGAPTIAPRCHR